MSKRKQKKLSSIIIAILFLICLIYTEYMDSSNSIKDPVYYTDNLVIEYLNVGQGDSIIISNNNHNMVIDGGNNADGKLIVNHLKEKGITNLESVIGTHPHEDHIGGLDTIIKSFEVNKVYIPEVTTTTKSFTDLLSSIESKNLSITIPKNDEVFYLGDAKVTILYNGGNNPEDLNACSIILRIDYGNTSFLFTGDTTSEVEKTILDKELNADVLKVAHHGSPYSSSLQFVSKVKPKYSIISVGVENPYNHPSQNIINRLKLLQSEVYRTDQDGTILVISDGNKIEISTEETDTDGDKYEIRNR